MLIGSGAACAAAQPEVPSVPYLPPGTSLPDIPGRRAGLRRTTSYGLLLSAGEPFCCQLVGLLDLRRCWQQLHLFSTDVWGSQQFNHTEWLVRKVRRAHVAEKRTLRLRVEDLKENVGDWLGHRNTHVQWRRADRMSHFLSRCLRHDGARRGRRRGLNIETEERK